MSKKIFSYEEAAGLLPKVQQLTGDAVARVDSMDVATATGGDCDGCCLVARPGITGAATGRRLLVLAGSFR